MLARRLRSSLRLSSVAPPLSPFSSLLHHHQAPPAFFPSPSARARFAGGLGSGGGGRLVGSVVRSVLSVRATLRRPPYAPLSSSLLAGVLPASRPSPFPPAVVARGRCRPPSAASATVSTTGGAGAACFHHPQAAGRAGRRPPPCRPQARSPAAFAATSLKPSRFGLQPPPRPACCRRPALPAAAARRACYSMNASCLLFEPL